MKSLKDLLPQVNAPATGQGPGRSYRARSNSTFDFLELIRNWSEVVGPTLGAHTVPQKNVRKVLTILTNHSAFSEQLKFMEKVIIEKIEKHFPELKGQVTELRFIFDSAYFNKQKKLAGMAPASNERHSNLTKAKVNLPHPQSPEAKRLRQEAIQLFQDGPSELLETFISLYIQSKYDSLS